LWQICKDKDEAEAWFVGLKALISRWVMETKDGKVSDNPAKHIQQVSPLLFPFYGSDAKKKGKYIVTDICYFFHIYKVHNCVAHLVGLAKCQCS